MREDATRTTAPHRRAGRHARTAPTRRELAALADELGVDDSVVFTGRRSDVARLMAAADVFAMPSLEEPFGLVYLEAMAMRLPVVALDSGGTPEVVEHGRSGLLSAPGDIDALAANIVELLSDAGPAGPHGRARTARRRGAVHDRAAGPGRRRGVPI